MPNPAPQPGSIPHFGDLTAWAQNTFYALGQRVQNSGNIYVCTTAGTSAAAGAGPAGNGAGIVDNTAVWDFVVAASAAWVALTAYVTGDVVTNDGGKLYTCIKAGTSAGGTGPAGTAGVIADGSVTWSYTGTVIAQSTTPTSRVGDIGQIPGAPGFAGYFNWWTASIVAWLYYVRDFAIQAWTFTNNIVFSAGVTFNGNALFRGQSGDTHPAIAVADSGFTTRKLVYQLQIGTYFARLYKEDIYWRLTLNASWDGAKWNADHLVAANAFASQLKIGNAGIAWGKYHGADGWAEGAWSDVFGTALTAGGDPDVFSFVSGNDPQPVHYRSIQPAGSPTQIASGAGAGGAGIVGPTLSSTSTDVQGLITLTPGAAPANNATVFQVNFGVVFATGFIPTVILTPANAAAAALSGDKKPFVHYSDTTEHHWILTSGNTALDAATDYAWTYHVIGP